MPKHFFQSIYKSSHNLLGASFGYSTVFSVEITIQILNRMFFFLLPFLPKLSFIHCRYQITLLLDIRSLLSLGSKQSLLEDHTWKSMLVSSSNNSNSGPANQTCQLELLLKKSKYVMSQIRWTCVICARWRVRTWSISELTSPSFTCLWSGTSQRCPRLGEHNLRSKYRFNTILINVITFAGMKNFIHAVMSPIWT